MELSCIHLTDNQTNEANDLRSTRELTIGVIGFGNYGKAIAVRLESCGVSFVVGTRDVEKRFKHSFGLDVKYFMSYDLAIEKSDVIILAIPFEAYEDVVRPLTGLLRGKIVIDVSNAEKTSELCHADYLSELIPSSYVVKAFNTISAWSMEQDIYGASRNTFVCSNDVTARRAVMQLAQDMGFTPVERGRLKAAEILEKKPLQLFPEWRLALWITLAILLFQILYLIAYFLIYFGTLSIVWKYLGLSLPMVMTGWMAIWLLALTFLPGCIAGFVQLTRGTKYSMFPRWLDCWMKARKQLGLFALMFATIHACLTIIMLAGTYFTKFSIATKIPNTTLSVYQKYHTNIEYSLLCATISTTLLVLLGITSLPSVNQAMSWKEWDFIQSKLGYLAMFFGLLHVLLFGYKIFVPKLMKTYWKYGPPSLFIMMFLPMVALGCKIILIMPGVNGMLQRIRKGWEIGQKQYECVHA